MNIEEKYLEKIWTRINNGDDDRLMLSWDEQFDITDILKEYHAEKLALCNVVGRSEQLKALEELKEFAYDNCQPHNSDRLAEIMESL